MVEVWLGLSPVTLLKVSSVVDTKLLNVLTFPLNRLSQSGLDYLQMFGVVYNKTQAVIAYSICQVLTNIQFMATKETHCLF